MPSPATFSDESGNSVPEQLQGPLESQYLVTSKYFVTPDGSHCDRAGVGYKTFLQQPNKCSQAKDSCLGNQPFDIWVNKRINTA